MSCARRLLKAVIGFSNLLTRGMSGKLDERHQEFLSSIIDGGRQLKQIIDEMLQFAHLDQGYSEEDSTSDGRLKTLIDDIVADLQQRAIEKRVEISVDVDPLMPIVVGGHLLRTAINQLVLNAINFNRPNGTVRIVARSKGSETVIEVIQAKLPQPILK